MRKLVSAALVIFCLVCLTYGDVPNSRTETDIPYVTGGGAKQKLDLFLPTTKSFPTILFVHGGSLVEGDRKEPPFPMIGAAFQKVGIGCAVMSYRLGMENKWPAQPRDVAAAFAWLKKNITGRGGDSSKIFLVGHSSGALLAALVSSDEKYLKEAGLSLEDIAGCIPMGALLNDQLNTAGVPEEKITKAFETDSYLKIFGSREVFRDAAPIKHISTRMPPFLILVAESERYQPPILASAEEFASEARRAGAKAEVEVLKDRTHYATINKMVVTDDPTLLRIIQFIKLAKR